MGFNLAEFMLKNIRNIFVIIILFVTISGCSGGNSTRKQSAGNNSYTQISGKAFAGSSFTSGIVKIYDYSMGTKGGLLVSGSVTNTGAYQLYVPNIPNSILIEVTAGCYFESSISWLAVNNGQPYGVGSSMMGGVYCNTIPLVAALNIPSNSTALVVSVTPFTHAATGLAAYEVKNGVSVVNALNDANTRFTQWVGVDIIKTLPLESNGETTFSNPSLYGAVIASIPSWIFNIAVPSASQAPYITTPPSSILNTVAFAEAMRMDLAKDGILNGIGIDLNNNNVALSIGSAVLNTDVYRHQLALYATFRVRGETEGYINNTGSTTVYASEEQKQRIIAFLPSLVALNDHIDPMFENTTVVNLNDSQPTITLYNNPGATYTGDMPITGLVHDNVGIYGNYTGTNSSGNTDGHSSNIVILVDGIYSRAISPATYYTDSIYNLNAWINSTLYSNGSHTVTIMMIDNLGATTSTSISAVFAN